MAFRTCHENAFSSFLKQGMYEHVPRATPLVNNLKTIRKYGRVIRNHLRWLRFRRLAEPFLLLAVDPMPDSGVAQSVMIIAPHCDDESIGCGGAFALHRRRGDSVHVIYTTDSAKHLAGSERIARQSELRASEALKAIEILGGGTVEHLNLKDGAAQIDSDAVSAIAKRLTEKQPMRIYVPWKMDQHVDHHAAHTMLARAISKANLPAGAEVWEYEVWTPLIANRYVPIGSVIDIKERAIRAHNSQIRNTDHVKSSLGLAAYRGTQGGIAEACEAFFAIPASKLDLFDEL